jgi:hypothetical protein
MASEVYRGRYTAELDEEGAVVFLIGMRFNAWWRVDKWWLVVTAMPRMLRHLEQRDAGLLGWTMWPGRTLLLVQYWRSVAELNAFASDPDAPHAPAWREFNRRVGADGTVGVWHETYRVGPGQAEAIYENMPAFGLAAATRHVPVGRGRGTAKARMAAGTAGSPAVDERA